MKKVLPVAYFGFSGLICPFTQSQIDSQSDNSYLLLVRNDERIAQISGRIGLPGKYSHVELLHKGIAYSARYGYETRGVTLDNLLTHFSGDNYELRSVSLPDSRAAISWFGEHKDGKPYDLTNRNCVHVVDGMLTASGLAYELESISRSEVFASHPLLAVYVQSQGLDIFAEQIVMPDHFLSVGELVESGVLGETDSVVFD